MRSSRLRYIAAGLATIVAVNVLFAVFVAEVDLANLARRIGMGFDHTFRYGQARGFVCRQYAAGDGTLSPYTVFVPYGLTDQDRPPVILFLNGFGKNGSDGIAHLKDGLASAIWETRGTFPFIAVFPQCPGGQTWSDGAETEQLGLEILKHVMDEFHADPDRVLLTGLSSGGNGVWSIAANHPELFAGIIPISAGHVPSRATTAILDSQVPVWSFFVGQDANAYVEGNHDVRLRMLRAGASPSFTEIQTGDDGVNMNLHDAWSCAFRSPALMEWMWRRNRSRNTPSDHSFTLHRAESLRPESPDTHPAATDLQRHEFQVRLQDDGRSLVTLPLKPGPNAEVHVEFLDSPGLIACGLGIAELNDTGIESGWLVEAATDDAVSGGCFSLPDATCLTTATPESPHVVRPADWNDLRVRLDSGSVTASLNGWPVIEPQQVTETFLRPSTAQLVLAVRGEPSADVRFRLLRTRECERGPQLRSTQQIVVDETPASSLPEDTFPDITLDTIEEAWRRTEVDSVPVTVRWKLRRDQRYRWSQFCASTPALKSPTVPSGMSQLAADRSFCRSSWLNAGTRISRTEGLVFDPLSDFETGMKSRFSNEQIQLGRPASYVSAADAVRRFEYIRADDESALHGVIFDRSDIRSLRTGCLVDLVNVVPCLVVSPLSEYGGGIDLAACRLNGAVRYSGRDASVVLEERVDHEGTLKREYWLDPDRDFRIVRVQTWKDERLRDQLDVTWVSDERQGWIPSGWTVATRPSPAESLSRSYFPGNDRLFQFARVDVIDWSAEETSSVSEVMEEVPPGTSYFDQSRQEWLMQLDGGATRALDSETVTQLASGGVPDVSSRWSQRWLLAAVVLSAAAYALRRRLLRRRLRR